MRLLPARVLLPCATLLAATLSLFATNANAELFNDAGYRASRYRAPLPDSVPGSTTLNAEQLRQLIKSDPPVLIDVQAITLRKEAAEFGISWLPNEQRLNIPGSVWLPNVGYAELEPFMTAFYRDNLQRLTGGDNTKPVVLYCIADCWMSWNALRRASQWGYSQLYWLPSGSDGWAAAGGELHPAQPEPILDYLKALQE